MTNRTDARAYHSIDGWTAEYRVYWRSDYRTVMTDAAKGKPRPVIYPNADKATIAAYEALMDEYEPHVLGTTHITGGKVLKFEIANKKLFKGRVLA